MTALKRWIGRTAEKLLNRWYEGPEPPVRLDAMATEFANMHPHARAKAMTEKGNPQSRVGCE